MLWPVHLACLILPLSAAAARVLNITTPAPLTNHLTIDPLPNPFDIPDSDTRLDFADVPAAQTRALPAVQTRFCFAYAQRFIARILDRHGNIPIIQAFAVYNFNLALEVAAADELYGGPITYRDASDAIRGVALKMAREGYVSRSARVLRISTGEQLGSVEVRPTG